MESGAIAASVCPECGQCKASLVQKRARRTRLSNASTDRIATAECKDKADEWQCSQYLDNGGCEGQGAKMCEKTCGLCSGSGISSGPSGACTGDAKKFDSGFGAGNCASYGKDGENHAYCAEDTDMESGAIAASVCTECGQCKASLVQKRARRKRRTRVSTASTDRIATAECKDK